MRARAGWLGCTVTTAPSAKWWELRRDSEHDRRSCELQRASSGAQGYHRRAPEPAGNRGLVQCADARQRFYRQRQAAQRGCVQKGKWMPLQCGSRSLSFLCIMFRASCAGSDPKCETISGGDHPMAGGVIPTRVDTFNASSTTCAATPGEGPWAMAESFGGLSLKDPPPATPPGPKCGSE